MSTSQPPIETFMYPDQSGRLILVGAFDILIGCGSALMGLLLAALTVVGPMPRAPQVQTMSPQSMLPAVVFYLALSVPFVWLGIGLIRARRWAWTLTVVLSWMWLLIGVVAFVMFLFVLAPTMAVTMAQQGMMPKEAIMVAQVGMGVFMALIYLVLPGLYLVLCHNKSVHATCLRRDPKVPWTDRCPMPVLAISITMALWVVSMPSVLAYGSVMPMFGSFISGTAGTLTALAIALALAYLAWGTYRLQMAAWWGTLLLGAVGLMNGLITFSRTNLMEMYEKMQLPADQLDVIRKTGLVESMSPWMPWTMAVGGIVGLGYLLYVRRYFVRGREATEGV
jgi:hypothetical protein